MFKKKFYQMIHLKINLQFILKNIRNLKRILQANLINKMVHLQIKYLKQFQIIIQIFLLITILFKNQKINQFKIQ